MICLDEQIYVLAMYLHLFHQHCFPTWSVVYTMASRIMIDLSSHDPEVNRHLKTISQIRPKVNSKVWAISFDSFICFVVTGFFPGNSFLRIQTSQWTPIRSYCLSSKMDQSSKHSLARRTFTHSLPSDFRRYSFLECITLFLGSILHESLGYKLSRIRYSSDLLSSTFSFDVGKRLRWNASSFSRRT